MAQQGKGRQPSIIGWFVLSAIVAVAVIGLGAVYFSAIHGFFPNRPDLRAAEGILRTGASLASDLSLLAYVVLLVPGMGYGYMAARRMLFAPQHKYAMTAITLLNWGIILFLMTVSYSGSVPYYSANDPVKLVIPTTHLITGALAQILATVNLIRMWFEYQLPSFLRYEPIKPQMRLTLVLWLATAVLGVGIYLSWYGVPFIGRVNTPGGGVDPVGTPAATQEATQDAPQGTPAATQDATQAPTPESTPESTAEATPAGTQDAPVPPTPAGTPEGTQESVPPATPAGTPDSPAPAGTEDAMPTPAGTPEGTPAATPEGTPEATPEATEEIRPTRTERPSRTPEPSRTPRAQRATEVKEVKTDNSSGGSGNSGSGSSGSGKDDTKTDNSGKGSGGDDKKDDSSGKGSGGDDKKDENSGKDDKKDEKKDD